MQVVHVLLLVDATLREPLKDRDRLRKAVLLVWLPLLFRPHDRWWDLFRWLADDLLPFRGRAFHPLLLLAPRVKKDRWKTRLLDRLVWLLRLERR